MGERKRIAFVSNSLWSIFHFRIHVIRRLIKQGYEVTVIAPPDQHLLQMVSDEKVRFIPLKHLHPRKMLPWQEWQLYNELKRIYQSLRPDLVFHYTIKPNIIGSLAAGAAKIKSVAVITGLGYTLLNNNKVGMLIRPLYKMALQSPEEIWFLNGGDRDFFVAGKMVPDSKIFLLPGEGVDTDVFSPLEDVAAKSGHLRFLMISRVLNNKGVNEFADAARMFAGKYPDTEFVLMGRYEPDSPDAIAKDKLEEWIRNKIIKYIPHGKTVREEIGKADCVVLPSYAEGLSVSLMEAAAMAKPVIASNVSGCRELVVDNKTGFLCQPRNAGDLLGKMERFNSLSISERQAMGAEGRKLIKEKFAADIVTEIYMNKISAHLQEA